MASNQIGSHVEKLQLIKFKVVGFRKEFFNITCLPFWTILLYLLCLMCTHK